MAAGLVLSLLALVAPLVYYGGVLFPFVVPKAVWFRVMTAGLAGLLLHGVLTRRAGFAWREDPAFQGLAGLLISSAIAAGLGVAPVNSFFGDLERMGGVWALLHVLVLYVALRSFVTPDRWPTVLRVIGAVVLGLAISGMLHRYGLWIFTSPRWRPGGLTGNPGYLAAAMLLGAALIGALISTTRGLERGFWSIAFAFCIAILFVAKTRAALIGLVLAGLVAALCYTTFRGRGARGWVGVALGAAALLAGLLVGGDRVPITREIGAAIPAITRLASTDAAGERRLYTWRKAVEAYTARPLLGWGPENEAVAIGSRLDGGYFEMRPRGERQDRSHNAYLGLMVTTGPLGLAAFVVFLTGLLASLSRSRREGRLGSGETALLMGALAGYAIFLVFWFEDLTAWVLLATIAAMAGTRATDRPLIQFGWTRPRRSVPILAAVWVTIAVLVIGQGLLPLRQAALMGRAESDPDLSVVQRLDLLESAIQAPATQRLQAILRHEQLVRTLLADQEAHSDPFTLTRVVRSAGTGLAAAQAESRRQPFNFLLSSRIASYGMFVYQFSGEEEFIDQARQSLLRIIALAPEQPRIRHLLGQVELLTGRPDRAEQVLLETLALHDGFGGTHHQLAEVALHNGKLDEALRWVTQAADRSYRPSGPTLHLRLGHALESDGQPAGAALAYHLYLVATYCAEPANDRSNRDRDRPPEAEALGMYCAKTGDAVSGLGSFHPQDAEVVARLPTARLRAGETQGAIEAALLLARLAPALRSELRVFMVDVSQERVEDWLAREAVVDPARVRAALEQQRAATSAAG